MKYCKELEELRRTRKPTSVTYYEDGGHVATYGKLNVEGLVKRLLESKYITD
jgi:hypothetical protein